MEENEIQGPVTLEIMKEIVKRSPFNAFLGAEVVALEDGFAQLEVPIRNNLTQFHGYVHGAVVGCVADNACAWAAASIMGSVVTAEYKINLLAPALGEKLVGRGRVIKASSRQAICRADVFAVREGREKLVATALATVTPLLPADRNESAD